jgi:alpha-D-xyloside xylohydrolase
MVSEQEELSGNPNLQLGGLLRQWPDDSDRHWLERVVSASVHDGRVVVRCATQRGEEATVHLAAVAPHVLRLTLYPPGVEHAPRRAGCLVQDDLHALPAELDQTATHVRVSAGGLVAEIAREPWELTVRDTAGRLVCREHRADTNLRGWRRAAWLGYRRAPDGSIGSTCEALYLAPDEHIYGLGEKFLPPDRRGQRLESWNFNTWGATSERAYKNVPFFVSSRGYGVFVNTTFRVSWDVGSGANTSISTELETEDDRLDLFIIGGPRLADVLERYTALTGRAPVPPRWSFGYWQSKYGYRSWDEVWDVVETARRLEVPLDVIHLDPYWQRERMYADLVWDERRFPDPADTIARLRERGVRVCLWVQPWIPSQSDQFAAGLHAGAFAKRADGSPYLYDPTIPGRPPNPCGVLDFSSPTGREWYIGKVLGLIAQGVSAFKTDFGEAIPEDAVFANGMRGRQMHNLYPLLYHQAFYEAFERSGRAGDLVCWGRAGWAGIQRYPVGWSGDMLCNFPSMACTLWGGLAYSLSGVPFWSHDIGGFQGETNPELYIRWAQWGLLCSHSRGHGTTSREPWAQGEQALAVFKRYAELRYRLIPYLYSYAHLAHRTGLPVLRPLVLEFPDDPATYAVDLQYLLGSELLVAPVFEAGAVERDVYLPAGGWYDFWTETPLAGGSWLSAAAPLESLPLFVRAGRILPLGPLEQFVGQAGTTELSLQVYPRDGEAEGVLHEDGGQTRLVYRDGQLSIVPEGDILRERTYHVRLAGHAGARTHQVSGPTTIHL